MDLRKRGFHVIEGQKFGDIHDEDFTLIHKTSIINLLRLIETNSHQKLTIVEGLDRFLKYSTDEAIEQARKVLNTGITDMLAIDASLIFVVECDIERIPDNPSIHDRPLAMILPRPHDIGSMEPGYLYYPIM
ncbi:MAG: hypothetical protein HXS52_05765 [Theionarchaea archaeon]|nr:hypothetical protein [Theionarchaea archaeon]